MDSQSELVLFPLHDSIRVSSYTNAWIVLPFQQKITMDLVILFMLF